VCNNKSKEAQGYCLGYVKGITYIHGRIKITWLNFKMQVAARALVIHLVGAESIYRSFVDIAPAASRTFGVK
jgi:hypothetical protein